MDAVVLSAMVGAGSAIATNLIASLVNASLAQSSRRHDMEKEVQRAYLQNFADQQTSNRKYYERGHVLLSILQREFSITSLSIDWGAKLKICEWDMKYKSLCAQADELRMIASLFGGDFAARVEEIYDYMNIYWGNFRTFLYRIEQGDSVDWQSPGYQDAHDAANRVGGLARQAKDELRIVMEQSSRKFAGKSQT